MNRCGESPILFVYERSRAKKRSQVANFGEKENDNYLGRIFFSKRFCRRDFFTKIFIVRILPSNEEKQSGPKMKTWVRKSPRHFSQKKDERRFRDKISSHLLTKYSCPQFAGLIFIGISLRFKFKEPCVDWSVHEKIPIPSTRSNQKKILKFSDEKLV
jgi:hypothetical protein